jgi:hypothetical protein
MSSSFLYAAAFRLVRFKDGVLIDKNLRNKRVRGFGFKDVIWHHAPGTHLTVQCSSPLLILRGMQALKHVLSVARHKVSSPFGTLRPVERRLVRQQAQLHSLSPFFGCME